MSRSAYPVLTSSNQIFQHPHHPAKSWRARWLNKLRKHPLPSAAHQSPNHSSQSPEADVGQLSSLAAPSTTASPSDQDSPIFVWLARSEICPPASVGPPGLHTSLSCEPKSSATTPVSANASSHFRKLTHTEPPGRNTKAQLRQDSEKTLRETLGLSNPRDFSVWMGLD